MSNDHAAIAVADELRQRIISATYLPGQRLSEATLAAELEVSRNTLREAFRVLTEQRLIVVVPHRGVSVAMPQASAVIDVYRVRRIVEPGVLHLASPLHPAADEMRAAVEAGEAALAAADWDGVGTANMRFHAAIVGLADSTRLDRQFRNISAELRLAFVRIDEPHRLHAPFVERNRAILDQFLAGRIDEATTSLVEYLTVSERSLLGAYARLGFE